MEQTTELENRIRSLPTDAPAELRSRIMHAVERELSSDRRPRLVSRASSWMWAASAGSAKPLRV